MFIINDKSKKMILTKGDNATFVVKAYLLDGKEMPIVSTDTVVFTVRENPSSATALISKSNHDGKFALLPSDTNNLNPGLYCYDIQLTDGDNNVCTIIPQSFFELRLEITR